MPDEPLQLKMNFFIDAWILEDAQYVDRYDWSVLVTTEDEMIRIHKYASKEALLIDLEENARLRAVFVGDELIQVSSVNSYSQMKSIELYENQMLDI